MPDTFFLQDAMSVSRNIIKNPKLVPGGGATELTVSATLKQKSATIEGIEKVGYGFYRFPYCCDLLKVDWGLSNFECC